MTWRATWNLVAGGRTRQNCGHRDPVFQPLHDDPGWLSRRRWLSTRCYPGILLNNLTSDQRASPYIAAPSRNGAPGNWTGAPGEVK